MQEARKPPPCEVSMVHSGAQAGQLELAAVLAAPVSAAAASASVEAPYIHSPSAAHEPPVRNMSMSTASTSGSVELPARTSGESDAAAASSTFAGAQVCCCPFEH